MAACPSPSSPAHTDNGVRKLIQISGTRHQSREGDRAPEVPCTAPRGRGRRHPGALGGHGKLWLGQFSLLLLLLVGRVLEPQDGVWDRDCTPVTSLCQLPITPLCWVLEEGLRVPSSGGSPGTNAPPQDT